MKEYIVDRDRRVAIYELHEALVAAGSSEHDHVFEQEINLINLIAWSWTTINVA